MNTPFNIALQKFLHCLNMKFEDNLMNYLSYEKELTSYIKSKFPDTELSNEFFMNNRVRVCNCLLKDHMEGFVLLDETNEYFDSTVSDFDRFQNNLYWKSVLEKLNHKEEYNKILAILKDNFDKSDFTDFNKFLSDEKRPFGISTPAYNDTYPDFFANILKWDFENRRSYHYYLSKEVQQFAEHLRKSLFDDEKYHTIRHF